jgi:hypothetical protein
VALLKELAVDSGKKVAGNLATQGIKSHFGAQHGFDLAAAGEAMTKPFADKGKEVIDGFKGVREVGEGVGKMAQGDFAEGAKQAYEGEQKVAKVAKSAYGVARKDPEPAASGDGTSSEGGDGGSSEGGGSSSSSSSEGGSGDSSSPSSSPSSGSDGEGSSSATPASGGARPRPAVVGANTDNNRQDQADRVRDAFG